MVIEEILQVRYFARWTHPEALCAISIAAQFMANPGKSHVEFVKDIIKYMNGSAGTKFTNAKAKARIMLKWVYRFRDLGPLDVHLQLARVAFVATEFLSFLARLCD
jgi:hypothetical protein